MVKHVVLAALVVSGCLPIYVTSPIHEDFGVAASMLPGPLEAVLEEVVPARLNPSISASMQSCDGISGRVPDLS